MALDFHCKPVVPHDVSRIACPNCGDTTLALQGGPRDRKHDTYMCTRCGSYLQHESKPFGACQIRYLDAVQLCAVDHHHKQETTVTQEQPKSKLDAAKERGTRELSSAGIRVIARQVSKLVRKPLLETLAMSSAGSARQIQ